MTVAQLIAELQKYPMERTVIVPQHSDYTDDVSVGGLQAVPHGGYIMRVPRYSVASLSADEMRRVAEYVVVG